MCDPTRQPLSDWIQEAYEIIVAHVDIPGENIPRERAHEILLAHEQFADEPGDAAFAIERLLDRGWFYEVRGDIRVTDPEHDISTCEREDR